MPAKLLKVGDETPTGHVVAEILGQGPNGAVYISTTHTPILITGKRSNAVLIAEEDWRAIQETVYLLSIPGMRESIREGLNTPIEECTKDSGW